MSRKRSKTEISLSRLNDLFQEIGLKPIDHANSRKDAQMIYDEEDEDEKTPPEGRWDYDHGPDHMREILEG
jgi:hypothetical protein